ncbi:MAG: segregation/condensation protein A [Candidatus Diapherotrites archaeon]|nr:segregation/condensation protein A [Candidatus Diapherotrites archaeon]MBT4597147.1 segregation/condensation protein A [Candidatus Diapherotrites archaeon]
MPNLTIEAQPVNGEEAFERDYSQMDLVDLIDQPAWKTILVDLVKSAKMDPWDIDVSELTGKYLEKINQLEHNSLRVPANAILACAILVKTKSKYLKLSSVEEEEEEKQELTEDQRELFLEELPDLIANRSLREGRISLDELVDSIEGIIQQTDSKKGVTRNIPRMELDFDTTSIEERLEEVFDLIKNKADSQGIVLFDDLVTNKENDSIIDTFLPVLFLMNSGKILAYQEEFFGSIFVKLLTDSLKAN